MSIENLVIAVQNYERVKRERDELAVQHNTASKQLENKKKLLDDAEAEVKTYEERIRGAAKAL